MDVNFEQQLQQLEELRKRVSRTVDKRPPKPEQNQPNPEEDFSALDPNRVIAEAMKRLSSGEEVKQADQEPAKEPETQAETKPETEEERCPQCFWPIRTPPDEEPTEEDQWLWVQHFLTETPFRRSIPLLGGSLIVEFREPTVGEMDIIYKQTYYDLKAERILTELDYWERVNRYRLYVQLVRLETSRQPGVKHILPDGLTKESNPFAKTFWELEPVPGETIIPVVESEILKKVLKTETIFRAVHHACNRFNRLVARLDALTKNPNFIFPDHRSG